MKNICRSISIGNSRNKQVYLRFIDSLQFIGDRVRVRVTGNFKFIDPTNFDINKINANDKYGYMLEGDLEYPHELHDSHSDYPLAPERLLVDNNM